MNDRTWRLASPSRTLAWLLLITILLVAFFMRVYELNRFPRGPFSDEAAAVILAGEVATGQSLPIFITAYTGHEVLFYYLSAPVMWLMETGILALRLTSALVGVATVAVTYLLARELFDDEPIIESRWVGLFATALAATSFWHISISRYGYRAITLPLIQSLTLLALWRGLRRSSRRWMIVSGMFCGLIAYTYLSSRIVPVALAIVLLLILIAERKRWRLRLAQLVVFLTIALVVFAPLGIFFVTHPETFAMRMTQVSVFAEGSPWQSIVVRNTLRALEVFTSRGDPMWRYGLPNLPMFQGPLALAFYAGLIVIFLRLLRPSGLLGRVRYALILVWPLVMLIPTILSDPIEVPHNLRALGILPLTFFIPALGLVAAIGLLKRMVQSERAMTAAATAVFALTLGVSSINTFENYFVRWGPAPRMYYDNNEDIADMARYLDSLPDDGRPFYVGAPDYRHPTVAAVSRSYGRIKWMLGAELFAFAPGPAVYAWPHASMPDDWWLARFFPPESRVKQGLGPDGDVAYIVHALDHAPEISPSHPLSVTFGGVIQAIGYDVLRDRPSGGRTDVAVYWRVLRKPDRGDYSEFITLSDAWGITWGQGGSFAYPSEQWSPGEIITERVRVQTDEGTPPGNTYTLNVGWWSASTGQRLPATDAQGRFAGTTIAVGPVTVTRRIRPLDVSTVNISHRLPSDNDFGGLALLGFDQWPASVRQGESEFVTLYWQARSTPLPDRQVTLQLRGSDRRVTVLLRGGPVHGTYPTSQWEKDEFIADRLALRIPPDMLPGSYTLEVQVADPLRGMDDLPVQPLGRFEVQAINRNWTPPSVSHPMSVTLGTQVTLVGYDVKSQISTPQKSGGQAIKFQTVEVTLHWQALREMDESYTVFVHLVDASGAVRAQKDNAPMNGVYPTTLWQRGEFVTDVYTLDLPPGDYMLEVGMYLAETGARLPVAGNGDLVTLGKVDIAP
jgi:4-amino-4-deoxy-L-arabinose transferase-like glycosyltransferase